MTDPIRARLDADLNTTSLQDSPWLVVQYGDALRAVLDRTAVVVAGDNPLILATEIERAIAAALGCLCDWIYPFRAHEDCPIHAAPVETPACDTEYLSASEVIWETDGDEHNAPDEDPPHRWVQMTPWSSRYSHPCGYCKRPWVDPLHTDAPIHVSPVEAPAGEEG